MDLVLIRHPEVAIEAGVCYGQTDVPLRHDVRDLAGALTARMKALDVPACVDGWHASPLERCASLARVLSADAHIDARLMEMHFGAWEGRAWDTIDRALIDAWAADTVNYQPGGGESVLQMATRIAAFHADLQRQQIDSAIVICHAGAMRLLSACHDGLAPAEMALKAAQSAHQIPYGGMLILPGR